MFGIIQKYPECLKAFNAFMAAQREGRLNFADFFPANKQLGDGFDASEGAVVLVDVGGGQGHEIVGLKKKFPDLPGRTILQDRPDVVKDAQELDGLEVVPHDFFDPQPIQGKSNFHERQAPYRY